MAKEMNIPNLQRLVFGVKSARGLESGQLAYEAVPDSLWSRACKDQLYILRVHEGRPARGQCGIAV